MLLDTRVRNAVLDYLYFRASHLFVHGGPFLTIVCFCCFCDFEISLFFQMPIRLAVGSIGIIALGSTWVTLGVLGGLGGGLSPRAPPILSSQLGFCYRFCDSELKAIKSLFVCVL